jgi:GNAT superfamily N-acetyltransferase
MIQIMNFADIKFLTNPSFRNVVQHKSGTFLREETPWGFPSYSGSHVVFVVGDFDEKTWFFSPIGYCQIRETQFDELIEFRQLFIKKSWQNRGHATDLIEHVLNAYENVQKMNLIQIVNPKIPKLFRHILEKLGRNIDLTFDLQCSEEDVEY